MLGCCETAESREIARERETDGVCMKRVPQVISAPNEGLGRRSRANEREIKQVHAEPTLSIRH